MYCGYIQVPRDYGCVYVWSVKVLCSSVHVWSAKVLWVCTCVECQGIVWECTCVECKGIVGVLQVPRDCGCVQVPRYCGCVHEWHAKGLWVCYKCQGIVGVYMCGVPKVLRVCTCVEC